MWRWLFGHKWKYNFISMPSKRTCKCCEKKQKSVVNKLHGHSNG